MDPSLIKRYPVTIDGETASIGTANELAVALDVLRGQYDRAVLEQLGPVRMELGFMLQGLEVHKQ